MNIHEPATSLKGVGPKKAEALKKLNIDTLEDLIFFFPRDYQDRRNRVNICDLKEETASVIKAKVQLIVKDRYKQGRKQILRLLISDDTGSLEVVFFNAKYLQNSFQKGNEYMFYGRPVLNFGKLQLIHPDFSKEGSRGEGILPVYPLTKGVTQREMRSWQHLTKELWGEAEDFLSPGIVESNRLCSLEYALENIHFPEEKQKLLEAKYRLIFDEFLVLQTGLFAARQNIKKGGRGIALSKDVDVKPYVDSLPYPLTGAQQRCVNEIVKDLESDIMMNRLIQGDVGSGKTAVAEIAMYKAAKCGYQAVMMAPTEILAKQHFEGFCKGFGNHSIKVGFLSGSMKASARRQVLQGLAGGQIDILVGTHAVIQQDVEYKNLGLVITDEQHRFGVNQRVRLKEKGHDPNVLVMTATPIPRTLAVILYGDLDISVIDELPPGRQQIITRDIRGKDRNKCYKLIERELEKGRQGYVVAPLIEDSELLDAKSAEQLAQELKERFGRYSVVLIHGAMKQSEKDDIMEKFYNHEIDLLVATVVIEVGINVPNATVMVVENAERFGLAQLHQLRGRVGRGKYQSYCMLITENESEIALERAEIMASSSDGFFIAEEDLKLRGPGEVFGTRQHGLPDLKISDLAKHMKVLNVAKDQAKKILQEDPKLEAAENQPLRRRVVKLFGEDFQLNL
ncbi:MAG: ATP-dependent DNA helicase RecG [Clostridiales bacterium]|nr:ATP-dependent DNA helicase RecG [Clostridiales bacterium]